MSDERLREQDTESPAAPVAIAPAGGNDVAPQPAAAQAAPTPPPFVPKSPLTAAVYVTSSLILGITQGLGLNLIAANLQPLQASFGATQTEMGWLVAAFFATNLSGTILMYKVRGQFGLRRFAEWGIVAYVAVAVIHLFVHDLAVAIVVRAVMGIVAAPLSTLAFFYMLEWLAPARKMTVGLCFALLGSTLSPPLARIISPTLLQLGDWQALYGVEVGMALVSLAIVYIVPLTAPPRTKSFDLADLVSFPLMAIGFGCIVVVLSMGRAYWWLEAGWLGITFAIGIAALALFCVVELNRKHPSIDIGWLTGRDMLVFAGALMVFRLLLSEQSVGVFGLFTTLNMQNDQLIPLFGIIGLVSLVSTAILSQIIKPHRTEGIHLVALAMIAAASWLDAQSTVLSRPEQFYLSQALIGAASGLFLPPALLRGMGKAMAKGPQYILSFFVVFLSTQSLGGILGSAVFTSFVAIREQFHSNLLAETATLLDPLVAQRVQSYSGAYARTLTDPAQRTTQGINMLGQSITQQSWVLAYNDMFILIFVASLCATAALLVHMLFTAIAGAQSAPVAAPAR